MNLGKVTVLQGMFLGRDDLPSPRTAQVSCHRGLGRHKLPHRFRPCVRFCFWASCPAGGRGLHPGSANASEEAAAVIQAAGKADVGGGLLPPPPAPSGRLRLPVL